MEPRITIDRNYHWENVHKNLALVAGSRATVFNQYSDGTEPPSAIWRVGLDGIRRVLADARAANARVRAYGGKWSLSDAALCNDVMLDTKQLTYASNITKAEWIVAAKPLFPDAALPLSQRIVFVQCGVQVSQLSRYLEGRNLSLPTSGASNGQTLCGAVSTGTHGAALRVGSMQDYVRAIHLVTGPDTHVLLQPASRPVVTKAYAKVLGAALVNDDAQFAAALVSFGSFGILHGLIIEVEPRYLLTVNRARVDTSVGLNGAAATAQFDFKRNNNLGAYLAGIGLPATADPHHYEIVFNPYAEAQGAYVTVMNKIPYDAAKVSKAGSGGLRPADSIIGLIGWLSEHLGGTMPALVTQLFGSLYSSPQGFTETHGNMFGDSVLYPKGLSIELGVSSADAATAIRVISQTARASNFPGVVAARFVRPTQATLGFTRFEPLSCTIELPGAASDSTRECYHRIFEALDAAGITFTLHWGQYGDFSAARMRKMYGDAKVASWMRAREALLATPAQRAMFSNAFLHGCGLTAAPPLAAGQGDMA
jgi:hypothetical protein